MITTATRPAVHFATVIGTEHLPAALAIVEKANRKAERAGIENRFTVAHSSTTVPVAHSAGLDWLNEVEDVTTFIVLGEPLVVAGWEFVATITWDEETGLAITRVVPGVEVDLSAHRDAQVCQHCDTRRRRNDTYVVREQATGRTIQVGSTCLTAFLGIDVTSALWLVGETFSSTDSDGFGSFGPSPRPTLTSVVAFASAAIAAYGWVPASSYSGTPTKEVVSNALFPRTGKAGEADRATRAFLQSRLSEDSAAQARAEATIAWAKTAEGNSEYIANLRAAFAGETVSTRNLGLVVSAPSAYQRHLGYAAEKAAPKATSTHQGTVGAKITFTGTITGVRFIEGTYGTTTLLTFTDAAGNVFKWFASGEKDEEIGTTVTVTGTVKKHDTYRDAAQTVLTRCKIA